MDYWSIAGYVLDSYDDGMEDVSMRFFFLPPTTTTYTLLAAVLHICGIDASREFWEVAFFVAPPTAKLLATPQYGNI